MKSEDALARLMCDLCRSAFERGLTPGSSGNVSVRCGDGFLFTPTGTSLGRLEPARISRLDADFRHIGGDKPTKELPLHRAFYKARGDWAQAVVHLHSPHAVALSALSGHDPLNVLLPYTPYPIMRLGQVPLIPYFRPGDERLGEAVAALEGSAKAVLLANHGPVVSDRALVAAFDAAEEFEQAAFLQLTLDGRPSRTLAESEVLELRRRFPAS